MPKQHTMANKTNLIPIIDFLQNEIDVMELAELMEISINNYIDMACAMQAIGKDDQSKIYTLRMFRNVLLKSQGIHVFEKG